MTQKKNQKLEPKHKKEKEVYNPKTQHIYRTEAQNHHNINIQFGKTRAGLNHKDKVPLGFK